ncbi:MAG: sigma-70 family RNA polymerase sigma factor [Ruminococcus flavefaciens]|nr:sigma-70 family RNA polymerase sigma factor [Ruminococcus flavefaciens]MCM1058665.1 sigma-70 family RNA polymerase sigma factor [Eubacterium sp.]
MNKIDERYEQVYKRCIELFPDMRPIVNKIRKIQPPQTRECGILLEKLFAGDKAAAKRLVEMYLRNALRISLEVAEKFSMPLDEIFSETVMGLTEALHKKSNATNYLTYITHKMSSKALKYVRRNKKQFLSYEEYCERIKDKAYYDGERLMIQRIYLQQLNKVLDEAMRSWIMDDRSVKILSLRFGIGIYTKHSYKEIADLYGTDVKRIRFIERRALHKLKVIYNISDELEKFLE